MVAHGFLLGVTGSQDATRRTGRCLHLLRPWSDRVEIRCGDVLVCGVEHGTGRLVLVLHGAGVDSREVEACSEPGLAAPGLRRVSPDLPGHGRTAAPCARPDLVEGSGADSDDGGGRDLEQRSPRQTGSADTRGRGG